MSRARRHEFLAPATDFFLRPGQTFAPVTAPYRALTAILYKTFPVYAR